MKKIALILNLLLALSVGMTVFAQGSDPTALPTPSDDDVNRIAKNMYCPVCENIPLDVCETQACADWREEIRLRLSEGWSDQEIYDYFVERHGDRVLAAPPARGLNWLIYLVPPLIFAAGTILVFRVMRSMLAKPTQASAVDEAEKASDSLKPDDDKYADLLEEELKKRL